VKFHDILRMLFFITLIIHSSVFICLLCCWTRELSDGVQFFLLPVVLGTSLLSLGVSNTLFAVSFGWYFYITHLGYRGESLYFPLHRCAYSRVLAHDICQLPDTPIALPFLINTEVFLFPIAAIIAIYVFNFVGYPFGLGWNASRIVAYIYFED